MTNSDPCTACHGAGGHPNILAEDHDYRISRGWSSCSECGGTGSGEEQRRLAAMLERDINNALGE